MKFFINEIYFVTREINVFTNENLLSRVNFIFQFELDIGKIVVNNEIIIFRSEIVFFTNESYLHIDKL